MRVVREIAAAVAEIVAGAARALLVVGSVSAAVVRSPSPSLDARYRRRPHSGGETEERRSWCARRGEVGW